jgi:hypothetical protein
VKLDRQRNAAVYKHVDGQDESMVVLYSRSDLPSWSKWTARVYVNNRLVQSFFAADREHALGRAECFLVIEAAKRALAKEGQS